MYRRVFYAFLSIAFLISNFSFGYDHINFYSDRDFSYIISILSILNQIGFGLYSLLFSFYFAYSAINGCDLTILLSTILFILLNQRLQILVIVSAIIVFLSSRVVKKKKKKITYKPYITVVKEEIKEKNNQSLEIIKALNEFSIDGEITNVYHGSVVTLYEFNPAPGIKSSRIIALSDDIRRRLNSPSVRIAIVTGNNYLGIEVGNKDRKTIDFNNILNSKEFLEYTGSLPIILGEDIVGDPFIVDLSQMPHLLVAGTTGSGKSMGINNMLVSLLHKKSHEECKLILIDPKMLELTQYENIPHLLCPVIYEINKAVAALEWVINEMQRRYKLMSGANVRNIKEYKKQIPHIVIVIDEFADLQDKRIEFSIQKLSQMARAAGIHMIISTQRPSVDIITGVIKSNFPSRITFKLASKIDSKTIINVQGAEQLLGNGDMLYLPFTGRMVRVHSAYIEDIRKMLRKFKGKPKYEFK